MSPKSPLDALIYNATKQLAVNAANRQAAGGGTDSTAVWNDGRNLNVSLVDGSTGPKVADETGYTPVGGSPRVMSPRAKNSFGAAVDQATATKKVLSSGDMMKLLTPEERAAIERSREAQTSGRAMSFDDAALLKSANSKIKRAMGQNVAPTGGGGGNGGGGGRGGKPVPHVHIGGAKDKSPNAIYGGKTKDEFSGFDSLPKLKPPPAPQKPIKQVKAWGNPNAKVMVNAYGRQSPTAANGSDANAPATYPAGSKPSSPMTNGQLYGLPL